MILLTGGLGYIGSHTAVRLLEAGEKIVVIDDLSNSEESVRSKITEITNKSFEFYKGDVSNKDLLRKVFLENKIDSVIHFAGKKAVGESTEIPLDYYECNIGSTIALLKVMKEFDVKNFVFSSSATVYGKPQSCPITEDFPLSAANPYGRTKLFIEEILKDAQAADNSLNIVILRYFNPIGAHDSGLIGENPKGIPNNLLPYINRVATGKLEYLSVFGDDYETPDGTGVRDYIHVMDLAEGHVLAVKKMSKKSGLNIYNLGTGVGYSVIDIIKAYESATDVRIPYKIAPRRPGDIDKCFASSQKAEKELGFRTKRSLNEMCASGYNYEKKNI